MKVHYSGNYSAIYVNSCSCNPIVKFVSFVIITILIMWLMFVVLNVPIQGESMAHLMSYWCCALILCFVGVAIYHRKVKLCFNKIDGAIFFLSIIVALQSFIYKDLNANCDAFFISIILYFSFRCVLQIDSRFKIVISLTIALITIYECWIGFGQALGLKMSNHNLFQITGTLYNPGPYGGLVAMGGVLSATYIGLNYQHLRELINKKHFWRKLKFQDLIQLIISSCMLLAVIASVIILPATFSRAAWIASIVSIFTFWVIKKNFWIKCRNIFRYNILRGVIFLIITIGLVLCGSYGIYIIKQPSADGRLLLWQIDSKIILNNPLGVGLGKFAGTYGEEQANYFMLQERPEEKKLVAGCPEVGFNEFLQLGAETGIVGLILSLFIAYSVTMTAFRRKDAYSYALLTLIVFALFSYPLRVLPLRVIFIVLLTASVTQSESSLRHTSKTYLWCYLAFIVVGLSLIGWIGIRTYKRLNAQKQWKETCLWIPLERYDYLVDDGANLFEYLKDDYRFLYDYGYALYRQNEFVNSISVLKRGALLSSDPMFNNIIGKNYQALKQWNEAEFHFQLAHNKIPSRIYPLYLMAKMFKESGQTFKAKETAMVAMRIPVKVESDQIRVLKLELQEIIDKNE